MKKQICLLNNSRKILFFFFLFSSFNVFSQGYESLFSSNSAAWKIVTKNLSGIGTDSVYTGNDTIINSLKYKKIYSDYMYYNSQHMHGFLREDTVTGKAWYKGWHSSLPPLGDSTERLIMDVSLVVGDSFYFPPYDSPWPLDTGWVKVDSTYFVSGKKYVRFTDTTHWGGRLLFIEGIGTNTGIQYLSEPANTAPYLLCYYHDGIKLYNTNNSNFQECNLKTPIDEIETVYNNILIYPHPVADVSVFHFANPKKSNVILCIYDITGRRVGEYETASNKIIIYRKDMQNGLYYYRLSIPDEKQVSSGKIIFVKTN